MVGQRLSSAIAPAGVRQGVSASGGPAPLGPVAARERIQVIDVLRGFALFGILLVNMELFGRPIYAVQYGLPAFTGPLDRAVAWLITFLAEGKFYSLFSFLFGYGLTIQLDRAAARGASFVPRYLRRLLVLLLIGLAHAFLLWPGDILVTYAILGVLLLPFRAARPATLLVWALGLLLLPLLLTLPLVSLTGSGAEGAATDAARIAADRATRVYLEGSFAAMTAQRARDLAAIYPGVIFAAPSIFAMFLLGFYAGRRGIFQRVEEHLPTIRWTLVAGLGIGLPAGAIYATTTALFAGAGAGPAPALLLAAVAQTIGPPALCLGYVAAFTLLLRRGAWGRCLAPLAATGRLALSNYLLQTLICTTIFYGYGFGLYGRVGPAAGLLLTVAIYSVQVPLSVLWLRHFQFGPAEWLWRSLTYLRPQPLRASRAATTSPPASGI